MSNARPFDSLSNAIGDEVILRLKESGEIRGTLQAFDVHMNVVLIDAEEINTDNTKKFGTIIVRGDNIIFISPGKSAD